MSHRFRKYAFLLLSVCLCFSAQTLFAGAETLLNSTTTRGDIHEPVSLSVSEIYIIRDGALTGEALPAGVSYDSASNTLVLNGCSLSGGRYGAIEYSGENTLNIRLEGNNTVVGYNFDYDYPYYGIFVDEYSKYQEVTTTEVYDDGSTTYWTDHENITTPDGGVHIYGSGSLAVKGGGILRQNIFSSGDDDKKDGDIVIEDAALSADQDGIVSDYSNVTISNASIRVDASAISRKASFGITAGRSTYWDSYAGSLTITGSELEFLNCVTPLACNKYQLSGMNVYSGNTSAEYQMETSSMFSKDYENRYWVDRSYLCLTKLNLGLKKRYEVKNAMSGTARGTISFSQTSAQAGQKIKVTAKPAQDFVLKYIEVNGKKISGTSFVMPSSDANVKAVFELAAPAKPTLSSVSNTASGIVVRWKAVANADCYYIYRKSGSGSFKRLAKADGQKTSYTDKSVKDKNGTAYTYTVSAGRTKTVSGENVSSESAYNKTGKKTVRLTAPGSLKFSGGSSGKLTLKWSKNKKADSYEIQYSTDKNFKKSVSKKTVSSDKGSVTLTGLKNKKTYYVRIRSYKKSGGTKYYSDWGKTVSKKADRKSVV